MDEIEFIEKYCLVNGQHIKLNSTQKQFLIWLHNKNRINMNNDIKY